MEPPDERNITWEEYINAEPGEYPTLGRQLVYKESSKTFRATVSMVSIDILSSSLVKFNNNVICISFTIYRARIFH